MNNSFLNIDLYNQTVSGRNNGTEFLFSSVEYFLSTTNYPYSSTTRMLSYEPERNLFVVERTNNEIDTSSDSLEMSWVAANFDSICTAGINDPNNQVPVPSIAGIVVGKLYETDWVLQRHQEEQLLGIPTTLTQEQLTAVLTYRQALRDMDPTQTADVAVWPVNPLG